MPALLKARFDSYKTVFYTLLQARHKTKLQALMAVAASCSRLSSVSSKRTLYDRAKLFRALLPA